MNGTIVPKMLYEPCWSVKERKMDSDGRRRHWTKPAYY